MSEQEVEGIAPGPARRRNAGKWHKLVRRVHLYAGLWMMPWLLFFGLSGMLFNHPNVGEDVQAEPVRSSELAELPAWQPRAAAEAVLSHLNAAAQTEVSGAPYTLDLTFQPALSGSTILSAKAPSGAYMLLLDLEQARGLLVTRKARLPAEGAAFPRLVLDVPQYALSRIEEAAAGVLDTKSKQASEPLRLHPKIGPELRFRARDKAGVAYNLTFDPRSGELTGRRTSDFPNLGVSTILSKMHTTHHFTRNLGAQWFWALFEDLLGLSMMLWAVTGMIMWWKIRPVRIAGAVSFVLALGVAGVVMSGVLDQLFFGDVRAPMGPGE